MPKRLIDLPGAPLLDMTHAAYRGACRVHDYAAWVLPVVVLSIGRASAFDIVWCSLRWVCNSLERAYDYFGSDRGGRRRLPTHGSRCWKQPSAASERVSPVSAHRTWTGRANDRALHGGRAGLPGFAGGRGCACGEAVELRRRTHVRAATLRQPPAGAHEAALHRVAGVPALPVLPRLHRERSQQMRAADRALAARDAAEVPLDRASRSYAPCLSARHGWRSTGLRRAAVALALGIPRTGDSPADFGRHSLAARRGA